MSSKNSEMTDTSLTIIRDRLCEAMRSRWFLTGKEIDAVFADRGFFHSYLKGALARRAAVGSVSERPIDATDTQAIFFLTDLGEAGIIPDLLRCLRMSEKDLNLLYGDSLTEHLSIPVARLGHHYFDELRAFATDPAVNGYAREAAVSGVIAMPHFHPERRADVIAFIDRLLERQDIFPVDHLAGILCQCADSGLTELAERAGAFANDMALDERRLSVMATADDVRRAFRAGREDSFISRFSYDVYKVNKAWQEWSEGAEERKRRIAGKEKIIPEWLKANTGLVERIRVAAANLFDENKEQGRLRGEYEDAMKLRHLVRTEIDFEEFVDFVDEDVREWVLEMPFALAGLGMVDEAVEVGAAWAEITDRANFLGDRAVVLAEAGRKEEAQKQGKDALKEFPDDVWVRIKVGRVFEVSGDFVEAERSYRQALTMSHKSYDRAGVLQFLIPMLEDLGRTDEARSLEREEEEREKRSGGRPLLESDGSDDGESTILRKPTRAEPQVGRNDSCPCGSGKKYKKCHGAVGVG